MDGAVRAEHSPLSGVEVDNGGDGECRKFWQKSKFVGLMYDGCDLQTS